MGLVINGNPLLLLMSFCEGQILSSWYVAFIYHHHSTRHTVTAVWCWGVWGVFACSSHWISTEPNLRVHMNCVPLAFPDSGITLHVCVLFLCLTPVAQKCVQWTKSCAHTSSFLSSFLRFKKKKVAWLNVLDPFWNCEIVNFLIFNFPAVFSVPFMCRLLQQISSLAQSSAWHVAWIMQES